MSILTEFHSKIPHAQGDNAVLQAAFLRHLFPENFVLSEIQGRRKQFQFDSFKLLAADGWLALAGDADAQSRFRKGWARLLDGQMVPAELPNHRPALLGLALACRADASLPESRVWWQNLVVLVRQNHDRMASLLEVVLGWIAPISPANPLEVFALAGGLFQPAPHWDAARLAAFLQGQRKCRYPYSDDFFEDALRIYVSDFALEICLRYEKELLPGLQQQLQSALQRLAHRKAEWQVTAAALLVMLWMIAACYFLFAQGGAAFDLRARWDELSWVFLWLSGPFSAAVSIFRILFFGIQGRSLDLDLAKMRDRYAAYLLRRWAKYLKLPPAVS